MSQVKTKAVPPAIKGFLKKPALVSGEEPGEYQKLFDAVVADVEPEDTVEWLWTVRFVDCAWAALRWRRYRDVFLSARSKQALHTVVRSATLSAPPQGGTTQGVATADTTAAEVEKWLADPGQFKKHKIDPELVPATALVQQLDTIEAIERLVERAERRADEVIQHIGVRRAVFASRAREVAGRVLNGPDAPKALPPVVKVITEFATRQSGFRASDPRWSDSKQPDRAEVVPLPKPEGCGPAAMR